MSFENRLIYKTSSKIDSNQQDWATTERVTRERSSRAVTLCYSSLPSSFNLSLSKNILHNLACVCEAKPVAQVVNQFVWDF